MDRYHQVIEPVPDGPLRDDLERAGARLAACLDAVRATCEEAQARLPSSGLEVPGAASALHSRLSRAATLAAQAAEAAGMARVRARSTPPAAPGAPGSPEAQDGAAAVRRAVEQVEALVGPP